MNTCVIGASENKERYAYMALKKLLAHGHKVWALGLRPGKIDDTPILNSFEIPNEAIHTITIYVGPAHQTYWLPFILSLKPKRIIFNPGTENIMLYNAIENQDIQIIEACTLVLLSIGDFE